MMKTIPRWVRAAKEMTSKGGCVDLREYLVDDISLLPSLSSMRTLNLSLLSITSLENMKNQPSLKKLIADGSKIESLAGFLAVESITSISLKKCPVLQQPNFLVALLAVCPNLVSVNGKLVSQKIKEKAQSLPANTYLLINKGWELKLPITEREVDELLNLERDVDSEAEEQEEILPFEERIARIENQHEEMVRECKIECGFLPEDSLDMFDNSSLYYNVDEEDVLSEENDKKEAQRGIVDRELIDRITEILKRNGHLIDEERKEASILSKIVQLATNKNNSLQKFTKLTSTF